MSDFLRSGVGKALTGLAAVGASSYLVPKVMGALAGKVSGDTLSKVVSTAKAGMSAAVDGGKSGNLVSFSQAARVEPILLMDSRAAYIPFAQDVVHSLNSLFTAYYLQSIALDTNVSGVKAIRRLDKFNPDRDLAEATRSFFGLESYSPESYQFGLPMPGEAVGLENYGINPASLPSMESTGNGRKPMTPEEYDDTLRRAMQELDIKNTVAASQSNVDAMALNAETQAQLRAEVDRLYNTPEIRRQRALEENEIRREVEASNDESRRSRMEQDAEVKRRLDEKWNSPERRLEVARQDAKIRQLIEQEFASKSYAVSTRDVTKMVTDLTNMAVGKVIEVTISENGQEARIPVTVRTRVTSMPSEALVETLAVGGTDMSARARWRKFRAKELSFWGDIILATDRIDAHRRALAKDSSGYYQAVYNRAGNNLKAEVMGGGPSVGTASSIIVITEQTKLELERKIGAPLSDYKTRQGIFINTFSILLAVMDPEWEEVTIYHRGIEMPTKLKASQLSASAKGNGPDVAEILKAYQLGSAPRTL